METLSRRSGAKEAGIDDAELDAVFLALASTTRRRILDIVAAAPGCTLNHVAEQFDMSRIGVLKHVNVLEDAGLVVSEKLGRERPLHFNPVPLQLIHERWSDQYRSFWASRLTRLKYAVEGRGNR
jgi:DNA-binding transcriptional ArsR family regulator